MSSNDRFKSAHLKISRGLEFIDEIEKDLLEKRPFRYILETNAKAGRRITYAERDEALLDALSLKCGDAVQNLCPGIDHAYTAVVKPYARTDKEARNIQFPFSATADRLKEACHNRLARRVSTEFRDAIMALKPHGEAEGNQVLYFMSALNNPDKHASLIPIGYYLSVVVGDMRQQIPDFMMGMSSDSKVAVSQNGCDFSWACKPFTMNDWVVNKVPANGILKQEVTVPVDVCFQGRDMSGEMLTVPTLRQFSDVANYVVGVISKYS